MTLSACVGVKTVLFKGRFASKLDFQNFGQRSSPLVVIARIVN